MTNQTPTPVRYVSGSDTVILRLNDAGRTLLSLPPGHAVRGFTKPQVWRLLAPSVDFDALPDRVRPATPSAKAISEMDEALRWLALIPDDKYVLRRIVASRLLVSPLTDRHLFPWRRIAGLIGSDHKAVQRWHADGIAHIVRRLAQPVQPTQTRRIAA
jgi:hypothetical protein